MADRRILIVVQADIAQPVGDLGFGISEYLLGGLLAKVNNRKHRYVTGTVVTAADAAALADAIEKIEDTPSWELGKAMHGDPVGDGVRAFCAWLRRGGFEIEEGGENVGEKT